MNHRTIAAKQVGQSTPGRGRLRPCACLPSSHSIIDCTTTLVTSIFPCTFHAVYAYNKYLNTNITHSYISLVKHKTTIGSNCTPVRLGRMSAVMLLVLSLSFLALTLAHSIVTDSFLQKHQTLCHDDEKLALLQFKQSFYINCSSAYDPASAFPKVISWKPNGADCCRWDGVQCDMNTGHVTGINLSNSCLYGNFPSNSAVFQLDHLMELNLARNFFNYSHIPPAIGRLSRLISLNLSNSHLSGQIPSELSQLSTLSLLDLSSHPDQIIDCVSPLVLHDPPMGILLQNLTHLAQLYLACVDISSKVPHLLGNMTSLTALDLTKTNLYGPFPGSILQLPNLEEVTLSFNDKLGGNFPNFPSNSALRTIHVSFTAFSGELPPSIGKLGQLRILDLWNSHFSGPIPSSLGNLTRLTFLDLGDNAFVGGVPSSLTNLTELSELALSGISVNPEELDSWLPKLHKLTQLFLSRTNLGGVIPESLRNHTELIELDLSDNKLTGQLPDFLANMTQLTGLDLLGNHLYGPVPHWLTQLTNLQQLYIQYDISTSTFDTFLKLNNLQALGLVGVSLTYSPCTSFNASVPKFNLLSLNTCNLTEFPQFLHNQDQLRYLSLKGNSVTGDIPHWFVNITRDSLYYLDLSYNSLTGFERPPVFLPWSSLEFLNFNGNKFQGQLPSPPSSLKAYLVSYNQFYGVIPKQICEASSLIFLDLSNNNMSGQIPHCIGHLDSLLVLNLLGNELSGNIPQTFSKSCQMKSINLSKNILEGELPKSLNNCRMLEVLDIGQNQMEDIFPAWLGSLPRLQVLVLSHNKLHGNLSSPKTNQDFRRLRIIDISNNFFFGSLTYMVTWRAMMTISKEGHADSSNSKVTSYFVLPVSGSLFPTEERIDYSITLTYKGHETYYSEILTVFRVIDFSSNNFTGTIPDVIGKLKGLQALNLSNNNLEGDIPSSLAKVMYLESLDLSQNKLSGEIPNELTQLTSLAIFNVSHNRLVGSIPQGNQFNTFDDNSSFDGNLGLCGFPLSKKCENIDFSTQPSHPMQTSDEEEEDYEFIDWAIRACGCLSGLMVGFIMGKLFITDRYHDWFMETFAWKRRSKRVQRQWKYYNITNSSSI